MKKTLSRAIGRLVDLPQCIRQMLLFFGKVTKMVDNIVEHQDDEFVSVLQIENIPESEDDPEELQQVSAYKYSCLVSPMLTIHRQLSILHFEPRFILQRCKKSLKHTLISPMSILLAALTRSFKLVSPIYARMR